MIPIGSGELEVSKAVADAGIGADGLSSYFPPNASGTAGVQVRLDPNSFGIIKNEHAVLLHFNREGRLEEIDAKIWHTGP